MAPASGFSLSESTGEVSVSNESRRLLKLSSLIRMSIFRKTLVDQIFTQTIQGGAFAIAGMAYTSMRLFFRMKR